jgi:hypothetical protein
MEEHVVFYPSHLAKGLVALGISALGGVVCLAFGRVAIHELMRIGTDIYPAVTPTFRVVAKELAEGG